MSKLSIYDYDKLKSWKDKFKSNNISILDTYVNNSWLELDIIEYFKEEPEKTKNINTDIEFSLVEKEVFPYPDLVFNAFNLVDYDDIKVVILGQDPYFSKRPSNLTKIKYPEYPEAMGLSFSVPYGVHIPSSLSNIYKNAVKYNHKFSYPEHGNLEFWSNQGVFC
jgi:uracil-DNA glycosylase